VAAAAATGDEGGASAAWPAVVGLAGDGMAGDGMAGVALVDRGGCRPETNCRIAAATSGGT
jgi:hypothetical protein